MTAGETAPSGILESPLAPELRNPAQQAHDCEGEDSYLSGLTLGGMRPGTVRMHSSAGAVRELRWTPCLTRAQDSIWEHCWFLDRGESLYCHECRTRKPRVYMGPIERIDLIKEALFDQDHARVHELLLTLHDPRKAA